MFNLFRVCFLFSVLISLTGCSSFRRSGFPASPYNGTLVIEQIRKEQSLNQMLGTYNVMREQGAGVDELKTYRDKVISVQLTKINLNYNAFLAEVATRRQVLDLASDLTQLGLGLATAASGSSATQSVLGSISAGVAGSQASVHKNLFFDQTLLALIAAMNAQRKTVFFRIRENQQQPIARYPLTDALSDLDDYYFAGTFIGALQAIQRDAVMKEARIDEGK